MSEDRHMLGAHAGLDDGYADARPASVDRQEEREQQLAVMVPAEVKAAVRRRAHEEGITVRALLLRLIREAGIASVADSDLADRRVAAAALKSRLYRDALRRS
jgi:hypothetical protein